MSKPREWWIMLEGWTNRALVRAEAERYPGDIAGHPNDEWIRVIEKSAYDELLDENERLRAVLLKLKPLLPDIMERLETYSRNSHLNSQSEKVWLKAEPILKELRSALQGDGNV